MPQPLELSEELPQLPLSELLLPQLPLSELLLPQLLDLSEELPQLPLSKLLLPEPLELSELLQPLSEPPLPQPLELSVLLQLLFGELSQMLVLPPTKLLEEGPAPSIGRSSSSKRWWRGAGRGLCGCFGAVLRRMICTTITNTIRISTKVMNNGIASSFVSLCRRRAALLMVRSTRHSGYNLLVSNSKHARLTAL
ncbi:MAG: hypothetical protein OHK0022_56040 [Roseiflexaceae bacterium]